MKRGAPKARAGRWWQGRRTGKGGAEQSGPFSGMSAFSSGRSAPSRDVCLFKSGPDLPPRLRSECQRCLRLRSAKANAGHGGIAPGPSAAEPHVIWFNRLNQRPRTQDSEGLAQSPEPPWQTGCPTRTVKTRAPQARGGRCPPFQVSPSQRRHRQRAMSADSKSRPHGRGIRHSPPDDARLLD